MAKSIIKPVVTNFRPSQPVDGRGKVIEGSDQDDFMYMRSTPLPTTTEEAAEELSVLPTTVEEAPEDPYAVPLTTEEWEEPEDKLAGIKDISNND
jgi:hypothetical protein